MIESINQAGGGAGNATDELAKVSSNDTTAGYLNGKLVAGSGIALTENNNGGNETLGIAIGNHDASLITTGTVATARLGTGTANSTTYLAGDQTYKAAVTSVNSSTGAVSVTTGSIGAANASHTHAATDITSGTMATARLASGTANATTFLRGDSTWASVSAGDTVYPLTALACENTTAEVTVWSITVPANTWQSGEILWVPMWIESLQNSGSTVNMFRKLRVNGVDAYNYGSSIPTSSQFIQTYVEMFFQRFNSTQFRVSTLQNLGNSFQVPTGADFVTSQIQNGINTNTSTVTTNFAANITISLIVQYNLANASTFFRPLSVRAYKPAGQDSWL